MEQELLSVLVFLTILAWTLPWKGVALWKAANKKHLVWFIVLLLVNTLAILEILYIFWFSKIGERKVKAKKPQVKKKRR